MVSDGAGVVTLGMTAMLREIRYSHSFRRTAGQALPAFEPTGATAAVRLYTTAGVVELGTMVDERDMVMLTPEEQGIALDLWYSIVNRLMGGMGS